MSDTIKIIVVVTDLWAEPGGGWAANGSYGSRTTIEAPRDASDATLARLVREAAGITGDAAYRRDDWCGADWCYRNGTMGVYADIIG